MGRGKDICKRLKDVRCEIARANGIEFVTSECSFKGECTGTCPKCEAEVRYLEQQLSLRRRAGKTVAVAGIAASMFLAYAPASQAACSAHSVECDVQHPQQQPTVMLTNTAPAQGDSITVKGVIIDKGDGEPLIGATVALEESRSVGVVTDLDGKFTIKVPRGSKLQVSYIPYTKVTIEIPADQQTDINAYIGLVVDANADLQGFVSSMVMHATPQKMNADYIIIDSTTTDDPFEYVKVKGFVRGTEQKTSIYMGNKCIAHDTGWNGFEFTVQRGATLVFKTPGYKDVVVKLDPNVSKATIDVIPRGG